MQAVDGAIEVMRFDTAVDGSSAEHGAEVAADGGVGGSHRLELSGGEAELDDECAGG